MTSELWDFQFDKRSTNFKQTKYPNPWSLALGPWPIGFCVTIWMEPQFDWCNWFSECCNVVLLSHFAWIRSVKTPSLSGQRSIYALKGVCVCEFVCMCVYTCACLLCVCVCVGVFCVCVHLSIVIAQCNTIQSLFWIPYSRISYANLTNYSTQMENYLRLLWSRKPCINEDNKLNFKLYNSMKRWNKTI